MQSNVWAPPSKAEDMMEQSEGESNFHLNRADVAQTFSALHASAFGYLWKPRDFPSQSHDESRTREVDHQPGTEGHLHLGGLNMTSLSTKPSFLPNLTDTIIDEIVKGVCDNVVHDLLKSELHL